MASARVKLNNPGLLTWARETAGYSAAEIAEAIGKKESDVLGWERGEAFPTLKQLERLARKVKRPLAAFFLPTVPAEPPPLPDFRTLPHGRQRGQYGPKSLLAFREARNTLVATRDLLEMSEFDLRFSLPIYTLNHDTESAAAEVRAVLGISVQTQREACRTDYQASDMWRDALFEQGIVSMVFNMPMEEARGFSLLHADLGSIGVNTADPVPARIFSLFHEAYHLCLRRPGVSGELPAPRASTDEEAVIERSCDRFAASFLLPADDPYVSQAMASVARDTSLDSVQDIARDLKVSKYVVLRRALDLRYLKERTYWDVYNRWRNADFKGRKRSAGGDFVATRISHLGKRYVELVFQALDTNRISRYDATGLLGVESKHFLRARVLAFGGATHAPV